MNPNENFVNLRNQYDFQDYCSLKSAEIFDKADRQGSYPSRFRLITLLISDLCSTPFYLVKKIGELGSYILNAGLNTPSLLEVLFNACNVIDNTRLVSVGLMCPLITSVLRILSTASGILIPKLAIKGWKISDQLEAVVYRQRCQRLEKSTPPIDDEELRFNEVSPSNAIYYLGRKEARYLSRCIDDYDKDTLNENIKNTFSHFLNTIYDADKTIFRDLYDYKKQSLPYEHVSLFKKISPPSYDVKNMIIDIEKTFPENDEKVRLQNELKKMLEEKPFSALIKEDAWGEKGKIWCQEQEACLKKLDEWHIDATPQLMNVKQIRRIFTHLCLNLEPILYENNLESKMQDIQTNIYQLKNLFSQRFDFGRACFALPPHGIDAPSFSLH